MPVKEMYHRVDPEFKHRLLKNIAGETLKYCYQCGTCTATCPLAHFVDIYRPNKILHLAGLGIRDIPFSNAVLLCSACTSCTKRCPQGVKVHGVMHALKELWVQEGQAEKFVAGNLERILTALGDEMPIPVIYGWVALSPTSERSDQSQFDDVVINVLRCSLDGSKRAAIPVAKTRKEKVAIIGSGPAGLTVAWDLNQKGFPVTIFEALLEPGGMLRAGIPDYRLPKDVVATEIQRIRDLGVTIKAGTPVDKVMFTNLTGEYKAIFVATGAPLSRRLRIEGEDMEGVIPALEFLRQYNLKGQAKVGRRTVVIGGGNVAMDAARTALRCGADSVELFCLESRKEMPGHDWEIEEAAREKVVINPSWGPKKILGNNGKVNGVELVRCRSVFDDKKRFNPSFDDSIIKTIEADTVISAIGQASDLSFLDGRVGVSRGVITVDPLTMQTNMPGIFAGGDAVSGTASIIEAVVAGRVAADSIAKYLDGKKK